jgi:ElaB/YqjD/DUF883 family membrane-anchored ribosome-binding protein
MDNTYSTANVEDSIKNAAADAQEKASEYGRAAADKLKAAGDYFRGRDMREMAADLDEFIRAHPTQALIGAAAVGFALATLLRRH